MNIQQEIEDARKQMIEQPDGYGMPMLTVELDTKEVTLFALDVLGDNYTIQQQEGVMFGIGRDLGVKHKDARITEILMVSECWKSLPTHPSHKINPKSDPDRQELLIIEHWSVSPRLQEFYELKVVRSGKKVVDCVVPERPEQGGSVQVKSFYQGFQTKHLSDEELARQLVNAIMGRLRRN